ncbi:MAG: hypothetical protein J6R04_02930 [Clostridia bacterium]|nr:hypothetical protein [Clostridia bacterium]
MTKSRSTKSALLTSVTAMILCFAMLLSTTYAWFTDSASSTDNKIVSGNLDVELYQWTAADASTNISDSHTPVFTDDILWEPGMTQVVYLSIKNAGTLALKYKVALDVTNVSTDALTDVMEYAITPDAHFGGVSEWKQGEGKKAVPGTNPTDAVDVELKAGEEHFFALSVHMLEEAGNEYMNESITFDIRVLAGQLSHEEDSFGKDYDVLAGYPGKGSAPAITGNNTAAEIQIVDDNGAKVGSVVIPKDAAADDKTPLEAEIAESYYNGNFTVAAGMSVTKYDVSVTGLKDANTTPVKVQLRIAAGLNPATVSVYHYDTLIPSTYNPNTGYVTIESATFSPFSIVYDATSEYVPPVIPENPTVEFKANVTYMPEYVGEDKITWGNYGQWAPTAGLDANLEAAFLFACPDYATASDELKALIDAYRFWYCDFYVSLDTDLGANEIFLGGNYGDFGWVGFHNGDLTLGANEEIPLLGSVTSNPWTYDDVESFVSEFICGVGDVDNALDGAKFTVKLRLTNPEDEADYVDVNTVTYTFGGNAVIDGATVVTSGAGLQEAVDNGAEEIVLGNDIDLNEGFVIPQ